MLILSETESFFSTDLLECLNIFLESTEKGILLNKMNFSHHISASIKTFSLSHCSFYLLCSEGELHLPSSVCPRDFLGELEYWGLSALHLGLHFNLVKLQSNVMQNIFTIQRIWKYFISN